MAGRRRGIKTTSTRRSGNLSPPLLTSGSAIFLSQKVKIICIYFSSNNYCCVARRKLTNKNKYHQTNSAAGGRIFIRRKNGKKKLRAHFSSLASPPFFLPSGGCQRSSVRWRPCSQRPTATATRTSAASGGIGQLAAAAVWTETSSRVLPPLLASARCRASNAIEKKCLFFLLFLLLIIKLKIKNNKNNYFLNFRNIVRS